MFWFLLFSFVITTNGIINEPKRLNDGRRPESDYFLPDNIEPTKYIIFIAPLFDETVENPFFMGEVDIRFNAKVLGTSSITLNIGEGVQIEESTVKINIVDGADLSPTKMVIDREVQTFTIDLNQILVPTTEYSLKMKYKGLITNAGYGLFRGSYVDENNVTRYFLGSQSRPVYARRWFPCFDEPKYKATFELTVRHSPYFTVRSNMPMKSMTGIDKFGMHSTAFQETPKMSSYLLTLFVFQFSYVASSENPLIQPRFVGWAVPSKIDQMAFSQSICPSLVYAAEQYFRLPLPVPKMDQIALPELVVIAMENWGINTYREVNILADNNSPLRQQQTVGRFTGHEVLHHWIGDLVTLEWWDYLWIQEAFAMYFEYFFPNQVNPSWRMMDQFVTDLNVEGLHGDNINSPLTTRVVTPQEITNKFMGLTYTKGPAIIRMLESVVGSDAFQEALIYLIENKKYSTMTPADLWYAFEQFTDHKISQMMPTWTNQGSYPILFVSRDVSTHGISIQQTDSASYTGSHTGQLWHIPITFTTKYERNFENTKPAFLMTEPLVYIHPEHSYTSSEDWVILNLQFTGYYRVLYDNNITSSLLRQLQENHEEIHHLNRAQLIDDAFDFADKRIIPYSLAFEFISYLHKEREYVPLRVAFRALQEIDARLQITKLYGLFKIYMENLLKGIYFDIRFDGQNTDEPLDRLNREQVVEWACYFNVGDCQARSNILLKSNLGSPLSSLPPDIRSTVLCYAFKYEKNFTLHNYFISIIKATTEKTADEINALACSCDEHLVNILEKSSLPREKWVDLFNAIIAREEKALFAATYLTIHLDKIVDEFGEDTVVSFFKQLQSKLSLQGINKQLEMYLKNNLSRFTPKISAAISDLYVSLDKNKMWLENRYEELHQSLQRLASVILVTKYFSEQPHSYYDSFHLTKFIHSYLYNPSHL